MIHQLVRDERAASLPEYAYLIFFLSVGAIAAISTMMGSVENLVAYFGKAVAPVS